MAHSPVLRLARLLGGVVLMHGRLGHQVLGQLLVAGAHQPAVAGAAVVVAGAAGRRNAVAQVALRTAAPALAGHALLRQEEKRIERQRRRLAERERRLEERDRTTIAALEDERRQLQSELTRLTARLRALEGTAAAATGAEPERQASAKRSPRRRKPTTP